MDIPHVLQAIAHQERTLVFPQFHAEQMADRLAIARDGGGARRGRRHRRAYLRAQALLRRARRHHARQRPLDRMQVTHRRAFPSQLLRARPHAATGGAPRSPRNSASIPPNSRRTAAHFRCAFRARA